MHIDISVSIYFFHVLVLEGGKNRIINGEWYLDREPDHYKLEINRADRVGTAPS